MKPALLLVDLQSDHLATPELHPPADAVVARAAVLLDNCRRRRIPVIHVWTTLHRDKDRRLPHWKRTGRWMCVAGTGGHQPPARLQPQAGELIIHKTGFNAFAGATLDTALRRLNCDAVILAGVHLHTCIRTACGRKPGTRPGGFHCRRRRRQQRPDSRGRRPPLAVGTLRSICTGERGAVPTAWT